MNCNLEPSTSTRQPSLVDDGLPLLDPLCGLQASVATAYATVLEYVAKLQAATDDVQAAGFQILLDRLCYDALWATSEVLPKVELKIRRQRFISQDVYDRWRGLQARVKPRKGDFARDGDVAGLTFIHEHVHQRKSLGKKIKALNDAATIGPLLQGVVACVVTRAEHLRLEPLKAFDGWERYRRAEPPVGVYDRVQKSWRVDRST